jgi:hypothetical protein
MASFYEVPGRSPPGERLLLLLLTADIHGAVDEYYISQIPKYDLFGTVAPEPSALSKPGKIG